MLPGNASDAASMVAQAMSVYKSIRAQHPKHADDKGMSSEGSADVGMPELEDFLEDRSAEKDASDDREWDEPTSGAKGFKPKPF